MSLRGKKSPSTETASAPPGDEELLNTFGYKQRLNRSLKMFSMFAISFSVISLTTGIFTNFQFAISHFGAESIWLWPIAFAGALVLAFVLAELASRVPLAGYSYQWGGRLVGPGFGWFVAFNLLCCFTLASGGETLFLLSPMIGTVLGLNTANTGLMIWISVIVLVLCGLINIVGVMLVGRINNLSVATEILGTVVLGILVLIAFLVKTPHIHKVSFIFQHGPLHGVTPWYAAGLALLMGVFTIGGFEACADLGEEAVGVQRTVAKAIIWSVVISGVLGMITLIFFALGIPNLSAAAANSTPIAYIATYWFGSAFARVFLVTVVYSVFALMVVQIAVIGRLIFSLSRDNVFPGSKLFGGVDSRTKTPVAALVLTTVLYVAVMVFAAKNANAYINLIGATPIFASFVYLAIVGAYAAKRNTIRPSKAFDLGRWAMPLIVVSIGWELFIIADFTLPQIFHSAAEIAFAAQAVWIVWYFAGLRSRLKRGVAGEALAHGKLAGKGLIKETIATERSVGQTEVGATERSVGQTEVGVGE
ncbi:MAG TPA: amino acid permease [Acidimicrobiales bacterium]|nr:amino acid permease [Acidimicrobiales bacterium]